MEREQLDRLLAEYATGGLSSAEKETLFQAALEDQELFDQLMEEDSLREAIEMPGARDRLIDALQEEPVAAEMAAPAGMAMMPRSMPAPAPAPAPKRQPPARVPVWLAWAAGIGVVFVSGSVTYMMFTEPQSAKMAEVREAPAPPRDVKPFVPPAAKPAAKPPAKVIDAPPAVEMDARDRGAADRFSRDVPAPVGASQPLAAAPPPPPAAAPKPAAAQPELQARNDFRVQQQANEPLPVPSQQTREGESARGPARRQVMSAPAAVGAGAGAQPVTVASESAKVAVVKEEKLKDTLERKTVQVPPSVWRRTGDGVWTRLAAGTVIGRNDTVAIRYVPAEAGQVTVTDSRGARVAQRTGRAGQELELPIPQTVLARADGPVLALSIVEGSAAPGGALGGFAKKRAEAAAPVQILLRLQ